MSTPQNYCHQCLCPCSEPQLFTASAGVPPITVGRSGSGSYEVTAFSPGFWCTQDLMCALQEWSLYFYQSSGIPAIKPHWPSEPDSLGTPPPVARPLGWEACHGDQNFHSYGRTSVI